MDIKITPGILSGTVKAISSESHARRVLICAALADRPTDIVMKGTSQELGVLEKCLRILGAQIKSIKDDRIRVEPIPRKGNKKGNVNAVLHCGDSLENFLFLIPVAAALRENITVDGGSLLAGFPMEPLRETLSMGGCEMIGEGMPLSLKGRLKPGIFRLTNESSVQCVTGFIIAASIMKNDSEIVLDSHLEEEDQVDLTIEVLERYGIDVYENPTGYRIPGKQNFKAPREFKIEGDWSTSAYWIAANAIGNKINCEGLNQKSAQSGRKIVTLLQSLKDGALIDCFHIPDFVAPLAVVAAINPGSVHFENAGRLRLGETDRLATLMKALSSIGANVREMENGFTIIGKEKLIGGEIVTNGDPSLAMAFAIAATVCERDVTILGGESVEKVNPGFFEEYKKMGGKVVKTNG